MAKVGEEDPHCIVKEYPGTSGHNVNDWHWTEWSAMEWLKERADELFKRGTILYENKKFVIECEGVQWLKGDACVTNRKRRIGAFYALEFGLNFKGTYKPTGSNHYGIIEMPEISDENDMDEFVDHVGIIRGGGLKKLWLKKKNRFRRLKKLVVQWLTELKDGGCFKERVQKSIKELDERLEIENEVRVVSDIKKVTDKNDEEKVPKYRFVRK